MAAAALTGSENADEIYMGNNGHYFGSNHAGGILGGISTGQDLIVKICCETDIFHSDTQKFN